MLFSADWENNDPLNVALSNSVDRCSGFVEGC
jgi:hypothetical protein